MKYLKSLLPNQVKSNELLSASSTLVIALVVAEYLFKLGSFTLECLSFLGLWYVLHKTFQFFQKNKKETR